MTSRLHIKPTAAYRDRSVWAISLAVWVVVLSMEILTAYPWRLSIGTPITFLKFLGQVVYGNIPNVLLTPFVYHLGLTFRLEKSNRWRRLLLHLGAGTTLGLLDAGWLILAVLLKLKIAPEIPVTPRTTWAMLGYIWFGDLITIYLPVVGLAHLVSFYKQLKGREVRTAQLEASLHLARLDALKSQLHPHFLFNTLNTVAALMHSDLEAADAMLVRLGALLRALLENASLHEISLQRELDYVTDYLEIEKTRLGDRLNVAMNIGPDTTSAWVPYMVLQPIVENAVLHGVGRLSGNGRIEIQSLKRNGSLVLSVSDNGPGPNQLDPGGLGVGLRNLQGRLTQLYSGRSSFKIGQGAGGGATVEVVIPFCTGPFNSGQHADSEDDVAG